MREIQNFTVKSIIIRINILGLSWTTKNWSLKVSSLKFKKNNLIINGQSWRQTWFKYLFFIMDNLKIRSTFSQHLYTVYIRQPNAKVMPWKDKKREHFQTNIPIFLTLSNALNDALINPVQENSWNYSLKEEKFCHMKKVY